MPLKAVLDTEIGLLPEAQIAGRRSFFHPAVNKARQDVALLQCLRRAAQAAEVNRHGRLTGVSLDLLSDFPADR